MRGTNPSSAINAVVNEDPAHCSECMVLFASRTEFEKTNQHAIAEEQRDMIRDHIATNACSELNPNCNLFRVHLNWKDKQVGALEAKHAERCLVPILEIDNTSAF
jgi:hypothetical protein